MRMQRVRCTSTSWLLSVLLTLASSPKHAAGFSVSMMARESVAVIGGGIAGTSFAHRLATSSADNSKQQFQVTVFDTGRLRAGGRCSSRQPGDAPKETDPASSYLSKHLIDHAAQVLVVPEQAEFQQFAKQVEAWKEQGVVQRFPAHSVCAIQSAKSGVFSVQAMSTENMYYGAQGMGALPQAMLKSACNTGSVDVQQDVWVSPSNGVRYNEKSAKWTVKAAGKVLGEFDRLVIAHNGKCADRLMSKTPAKQVHNLLKVNFAPTVAAHGGKRMTLNSIYSLTVAVQKDSVLSTVLQEHIICGFVQGDSVLRFVSSQTRKYRDSDNGDDIEVWTLLSSPQFAKKHKAPQEFLPEETVEKVSSLMLQALEEALNLETNSVSNEVVERRLQLWGAGLPLNTWQAADKNNSGYVYDAEHAVGVCGDWLVEPSIAGAWTSGQLLADAWSSADSKGETSGLDGSFVRSEAASQQGIGALSDAAASAPVS